MKDKHFPPDVVSERERRPETMRAVQQAIVESAEIPELTEEEVQRLRQRAREMIDDACPLSPDESEAMLLEILHTPGEGHFLRQSEQAAIHYLAIMDLLYEHLAMLKARMRTAKSLHHRTLGSLSQTLHGLLFASHRVVEQL
ncbi:MAG: hypothetical protein R3B91_16030 [Planctomycetaceae bacterium]